MKNILLKIKILIAWCSFLPYILKDSSFYHYKKGSVGKFKLFGKQYLKQSRREKHSEDKSKTVTYVTTLSKIFTPSTSNKESKQQFSKLVSQTFLWYISHSEELKQKEKDENKIKTNSAIDESALD